MPSVDDANSTGVVSSTVPSVEEVMATGWMVGGGAVGAGAAWAAGWRVGGVIGPLVGCPFAVHKANRRRHAQSLTILCYHLHLCLSTACALPLLCLVPFLTN